MPAGKAELIFGPRGSPEVQQGLPVAIDSCEWGHSSTDNVVLSPTIAVEIADKKSGTAQRTTNASSKSSRPANPTSVTGIACGKP